MKKESSVGRQIHCFLFFIRKSRFVRRFSDNILIFDTTFPYCFESSMLDVLKPFKSNKHVAVKYIEFSKDLN